MPRDNEAPGGTRSLHRVELAAKLAVRDASATKGGMLSNFYEERTPKITRIVKRPGVEPAGVVGSGCGGQGFTEFNGSLLTVACDTLYKQHMVGLHAIVTTAHFPPGDVTENTGAGRYKFKFSPEQCSGEHVWSDPCDEDRESGEIDMEEVAYTEYVFGVNGVNIPTLELFYFEPTNNTLTTTNKIAVSADQGIAAGHTTYAAIDGTDLKIYNSSYSLLTTTALGAVGASVTFCEPYYRVTLTSGNNIINYDEAGALISTTSLGANYQSAGASKDSHMVFGPDYPTVYHGGNVSKAVISRTVAGANTSWNITVNNGFVLTASSTHTFILMADEGGVDTDVYLKKYTHAGVLETTYALDAKFDPGGLTTNGIDFDTVGIAATTTRIVISASTAYAVNPGQHLFLVFDHDLNFLYSRVAAWNTATNIGLIPYGPLRTNFYGPPSF